MSFGVVLTWGYPFVTTHPAVPLKSVHFITVNYATVLKKFAVKKKKNVRNNDPSPALIS